ncbi:hypothetical protein DN730_18535 [Marinomonas piezotolerans]|uniref:Uncharacterized protein n=1 Tax=Marinomonas piezotolerans TaxID=2213058 RepID=A0A370U4C7_9GAMM|nr:hypothetical protein [Marinomonas piezotolerans]RDL42640.1 hypothetical protein DN730_18535 [Marinomonas piezotolerans]
MTFLQGLIALLLLSVVAFVVTIGWYFRVRKGMTPEAESDSKEQEELANEDAVGVEDDVQSETSENAWVELIDHQIAICTRLLNDRESLGEEDLALQCWQTFLTIERELIAQNEYEASSYLERFEFVLNRLRHAQEIDALLKQLSVSNDLLKKINLVIQKTGDRAFEQMNKTAELNLKLDKQQVKLAAEANVDKELAEVRAELAAMYELGERAKGHTDDQSDENYLKALSDLLGEASSDAFLAPMRTELDDKVAELQYLADYRAEAIKELKARIKEKRSSGKGKNQNTLTEYDIAFVRYEKSLLESNKVIKLLESQLDSLQTIKYNLNIDVRKRDEELRLKDEQLKLGKNSVTITAQEAINREQSSVDVIAQFIDKVPLTGEYTEFEEQQSEKLMSLKALVDESELYVNVLERDLDKAKHEHDELLARIEQVRDEGGELSLSSNELEEIENLKEINHELTEEKARLMEELKQGEGDLQDIAALQSKIEDLDAKIETVQSNYVNMEERYLNSLMS